MIEGTSITIEYLLALPTEQRDRMLTELLARAPRRERLDQRDHLIRQLAAGFYEQRRGLAGLVVSDLRRFLIPYRKQRRNGDTAKQQQMRLVLDANDGHVPCRRQVRNILLGLRTPGPK